MTLRRVPLIAQQARCLLFRGRRDKWLFAQLRIDNVFRYELRIEHYEMAAYGCARTYARRLNRLDEARLLQETLDEEGRTDRRLTEIAEAHINDDARLEGDFQSEPPARRLRYVPMDVVAVNEPPFGVNTWTAFRLRFLFRFWPYDSASVPGKPSSSSK